MYIYACIYVYLHMNGFVFALSPDTVFCYSIYLSVCLSAHKCFWCFVFCHPCVSFVFCAF